VTGREPRALARTLIAERIYTGITGEYAGVFGIPDEAPREVHCVNTALFTTRRQLDRFVEALEREVGHG
jgi:hypothetical protein